MAIEKNGQMTYVDAAGNEYLLFPKTKAECVEGLTPEAVGAAPAGYGLGDVNGKWCADANTATEIGFYELGGYATANVPTYFGYGTMVVERRGSHIYQTAKNKDGVPHLQVITRYSTDGGVTWSEWEWLNPPMELGVEYRTTERRDGKVVYATAYSIGGLAGKGSYGGSSPYSGKVFECHGLYVGSDGKYYSGIEQDGWVSLYVTGDNYIQCRNNVDWHTHSNVIVTLKYTKD